MAMELSGKTWGLAFLSGGRTRGVRTEAGVREAVRPRVPRAEARLGCDPDAPCADGARPGSSSVLILERIPESQLIQKDGELELRRIHDLTVP